MISEMFFLQSYGYFEGGGLGNLLASWEQMGFFSYAIPFLLIFALVFGILTQIKLFRDNKVIHAIISLSVGLMALQFNFVSRFFAEIFPRLGVGLIVLLLVIILTGLFADPKSKAMMYAMYGLGAVIAIVILVQTAGVVGWYSFLPWLGYNWPMVAGVVAFFLVLIIIVISAKERKGANTYPDSIFAKLLRDD